MKTIKIIIVTIFSMLLVGCPQQANPTFIYNSTKNSICLSITFYTDQFYLFEDIQWNSYDTKKSINIFGDIYILKKDVNIMHSTSMINDNTITYNIIVPSNKSVLILRDFLGYDWKAHVKQIHVKIENNKILEINEENRNNKYTVSNALDKTYGNDKGDVIIVNIK